uniref:Protein SYM1 isoform X2 n=1 Tax=Cicer arietinum TaxID=3827 RepID=A0A3Q7XI64_CICAR|nr:protein SYM1 isoform X2 [Cicer arietinum]
MALASLFTPTLIPLPTTSTFSKPHSSVPSFSSRTKKRCRIVRSVAEDREAVSMSENRRVLEEGSSSSKADIDVARDSDDIFTGRAINATIVLGFGAFAVTKLLTIDHDYWHGWTLYEILRYVPEHNWIAYEQSLKANPVLAKMAISGVVYSIGDWIAQCYGGKPIFEFDRARLFRSGLVGFTLHGSLSHYYYQLCEVIIVNLWFGTVRLLLCEGLKLFALFSQALFPFQQWWVVPAKVAFDQTVWSAIWNSIYFVVLGLLRLDSFTDIYGELKSTFWPMLTAGWKLWPFAHLITYGVVPVEQRLLWVDCVELIWVTILSTYSNENSQSRKSEEVSETMSSTSSQNSEE